MTAAKMTPAAMYPPLECEFLLKVSWAEGPVWVLARLLDELVGGGANDDPADKAAQFCATKFDKMSQTE